MTDKTKPAEVGDRVHFLAPLNYSDSDSWVSGVTAQRGHTITVTEELLSANRDRFGRSWLDLVNDPAAQVAVYGKEICGPGEFPACLVSTVLGTLDHRDARLAAARAAGELPKGPERDAALAEVESLYGPRETTSTTHATYSR